MKNQIIHKLRDWNTPLDFPKHGARVTKVLMIVELISGAFHFPFPSITLDSENGKVDYSGTFEIVALGGGIYSMKSELVSDHHSRLFIEAAEQNFILRDGAIFIERLEKT